MSTESGSRYFQLRLSSASRELRITVSPRQSEGMSVLRSELALVGHNGRKLCQVPLNRQGHESALCIELPRVSGVRVVCRTTNEWLRIPRLKRE